MHSPRMSQPTLIQLKRKHAALLLQIEVNFLEVARAYEIAPRVLLAWIRHENGRWENDPYEGRGPGPDEHYAGDWPDEDEEFAQYKRMSLKPADFDDLALRDRYGAYLTSTAGVDSPPRKRNK